MKTLNIKDSTAKLALVCVLIATISRIALPPLFGHPGNFAPIGAISLFSGACFGKRWLAFALPLVSVWASDLVVDYGIYHHLVFFYPGFYWQYGSYMLIVGVGFLLNSALFNKKVSTVIGRTLAGSVAASVIFFLISNFGVWASGMPHALYPNNWEGLIMCYVMGIPFFPQTVISDLVYSLVLFVSFYSVMTAYSSTLAARAAE